MTFLKDIESPYEVNDYVRSYLGENKDSRDFAKHFLEKRSFYRNKAKQQASEVWSSLNTYDCCLSTKIIFQELMWGPAPAITPSANKSNASSSNLSGHGVAESNNVDDLNAKVAKAKKKKGKRIDSSILGFTVQADPDRINAGEIEHMEW